MLIMSFFYVIIISYNYSWIKFHQVIYVILGCHVGQAAMQHDFADKCLRLPELKQNHYNLWSKTL